MAQRVFAAQRVVNSVAQQAEAARRVGKSQWRNWLDANSQYVQKDVPPSVLARRLLFTTLNTAERELPVHYAQLRAEMEQVRAAAGNWSELPLATVGRAALFSAECFAWFCVGEIVGRGFTLTGYDY